MASSASFALVATVIDLGHRNRLKFEDETAYRRFVNSKGTGERLVVTFEDETDVRSLAANRYLWGVVYRDIEESTGTPPKVTHDEMCAQFLKRQVFYIDRRTNLTVERWLVGGTSDLTPRAFHEFVENVKLHAHEFFGIEFDDRHPDYVAHRAEHEALQARKRRRSHAPVH